MIPQPTWCTELLDHCARNVTRYRGLPPRLSAFPVVGKMDIVCDYDAFLSEGFDIPKSDILDVLKDEHRKRVSISEGSRWRSLIIEETSGTSGVPFNFPKLISERAMIACAIWKFRKSIDAFATIRSFYPFLHAP